MYQQYLYKKGKINKMIDTFLIEVKPTNSFSVFINEVELIGNKKKLQQKLQNISYIKKLKIHESFWFEPCKLVLKNTVDFPEYHI